MYIVVHDIYVYIYRSPASMRACKTQDHTHTHTHTHTKHGCAGACHTCAGARTPYPHHIAPDNTRPSHCGGKEIDLFQSTHACIHMRMCMWMFMHTCSWICVISVDIHAYMFVDMRTFRFACPSLRIVPHVGCVCVCVCVCVCTCKYIS